ncbi:enoyl-CoA hydratase/isomerase family protein [Janibacter massiliensis]|uniref:enoyl-CoA hydratase/isomerase family protein n=1 Tax=Janibacter massiliensis TaxID=2058291 RepID=UPI000D0F479B|nr:enoyl-CoA hydratase-related protein [Janibacter massiliensis]
MSENAATSPVRLDRAGAVATVVLDRPEAMNALDTATKDGLLDALREVAEDGTVRVVVLTGAGDRAFCVGQDLREHAAGLADPDTDLGSTVREHYNPIVELLSTMPKPVVAAVNGVAAGAGAAFAFACDLRIAADTAAVNLAFAGVALSCDSGASWTLPRLVGAGRALDLLLRPRTISAAEALDLGILTEVVPAPELSDRVAQVAAELAAGPTLAYASIRAAVRFSATHGLAESLENEARGMDRTGASADHREAVAAFLEKRRPELTGR